MADGQCGARGAGAESSDEGKSRVRDHSRTMASKSIQVPLLPIQLREAFRIPSVTRKKAARRGNQAAQGAIRVTSGLGSVGPARSSCVLPGGIAWGLLPSPSHGDAVAVQVEVSMCNAPDSLLVRYTPHAR